jgi:hypothetical protein
MPQDEPKRPWEERVTEASARLRDEVQDELKRVVRYIDDEVVPEVRRNGSSALRAAAIRLQKLAEHIDDSKASSQNSSPGDDTETH